MIIRVFRVNRRVKFIFAIGVVLICLISFHNVKIPSFRNRKNEPKFILYWSPFWNKWIHHIGDGYEPFKNCEYRNCYATANRSLIPLEHYDALLFHTVYNKKKHGVPWIRLPHQMHIFVNMESPVYIYPNSKQFSSYFNWTMSYRFDSDIVRRHGYIIEEETNYTIPTQELLKNKTSLAAWMASNCGTAGHREIIVKKIQNFMSIDVYGRCGKLKCPRKKGNEKLSSSECYDMIERRYKFYFSFENSYCKDYSTEKLYNILKKDVVPVVYGFGNYKSSAPPNSVINVQDFNTARKLSDYLKYLDKNPDEYLKYFKWKQFYRITSSLETAACQLCKKLHEPIKQSVYYDLHDWWWGKNKSMCKTGKQLLKFLVTF